jgi:flagellar biosynthesis/type III secretory pathway protein FliH
MKYQNTQKKVGDLMGGRVLELDIIKAHDEGVNEGRREGLEAGREEERVSLIKNLMDSLKCSAEQAMEKLKIPKSEYNKYMMML